MDKIINKIESLESELEKLINFLEIDLDEIQDDFKSEMFEEISGVL